MQQQTKEDSGVPDDAYPSRVSEMPAITPRVDPVIWGRGETEGGLSEEDADAYERDGFVLLKGLFADDEVEELRAEMDRMRWSDALLDRDEVVTEPGSRAVRSIFDIHLLSPLFAELAQDPRLVGVARHVLGDDVYVHQSRLNFKPGFHGKEFYWHSDFETWHVEDGMPRMRALSMSIALVDNTPYNGPLMLIPGSHRHYVACIGETPEEHYKQSLKQQEYGVPDPGSLETLVADGGIAAPTGPAGSVVVFDCNTMHGSNSNITPYPRSNAFLVFNACSNRLVQPFGGISPRPAFIAHRDHAPPNPEPQGAPQ